MRLHVFLSTENNYISAKTGNGGKVTAVSADLDKKMPNGHLA